VTTHRVQTLLETVCCSTSSSHRPTSSSADRHQDAHQELPTTEGQVSTRLGDTHGDEDEDQSEIFCGGDDDDIPPTAADNKNNNNTKNNNNDKKRGSSRRGGLNDSSHVLTTTETASSRHRGMLTRSQRRSMSNTTKNRSQHRH